MAGLSDLFDGMHGIIFPTASFTAPAGFLMCDGSAISRTTYAALFAAITLSATGSTTAGNATISSVSADLTGNASIGMPISGVGIPAGTTIAGLTATTITLSQNATATASGVAITVAPHGVGDGSATFNVPDLRGEFIRGLDRGRGVDTGRVLGKFQDGTSIPNAVTGVTAGALQILVQNGEQGAVSSQQQQNWSAGNTTSLTQYKVRPRNVAMNYVIKT